MADPCPTTEREDGCRRALYATGMTDPLLPFLPALPQRPVPRHFGQCCICNAADFYSAEVLRSGRAQTCTRSYRVESRPRFLSRESVPVRLLQRNVL
ncbi:hypothetical protein PUN4_340147 [Paraburkholderia unamae]|nr:hypothetical protein PUN4_340147 [Paraburkholderia unamae]